MASFRKFRPSPASTLVPASTDGRSSSQMASFRKFLRWFTSTSQPTPAKLFRRMLKTEASSIRYILTTRVGFVRCILTIRVGFVRRIPTTRVGFVRCILTSCGGFVRRVSRRAFGGLRTVQSLQTLPVASFIAFLSAGPRFKRPQNRHKYRRWLRSSHFRVLQWVRSSRFGVPSRLPSARIPLTFPVASFAEFAEADALFLELDALPAAYCLRSVADCRLLDGFVRTTGLVDTSNLPTDIGPLTTDH
jgi:hypothetical protein